MTTQRLLVGLTMLLAAACASSPSAPTVTPAVSDAITAAVNAPDRSPEDRALDAGRHPAEMLAMAQVAPEQQVAELQSGGGYTTELLVRTVGPTGRVFGHNTKLVRELFAEKPWSERLKKRIMVSVISSNRDLDDPFPAEARELDAVLMVLVYHDTVWQKVDRAKMNAAIFGALRSGGIFLVVDHSARPGSGVADVETLHRIDEAVVKNEVGRAGFHLQAEGQFLRNPADPRDWNVSPRAAADRRGTSDRFVLQFVKP